MLQQHLYGNLVINNVVWFKETILIQHNSIHTPELIDFFNSELCGIDGR